MAGRRNTASRARRRTRRCRSRRGYASTITPVNVPRRVCAEEHPAVTAPSHTAAPSALGYIYQCQVALLGSLPHALAGRDVLTTIEVFDDVAFEFGDATAREVLQVKHH